MKKWIAAILAIAMLISLTACGGKDKVADETDGKQLETITLGKYTAVFKGYTLTKDEDGNDAIVLTYDYTNGSKDEQSFAWAFLFVATQAGEELGSPMYDENDNQITRNYEEKIKKGETLEVAVALSLVNTTDDVVIVFSDSDDHEYTQTIKMSGSSGEESGSVEGGPEEVGSYKLYEMTFEEETFDNAFLESVGMDSLYTLNLAADGTGILKLDGDESSVTWKDGKITVDLSGAAYTYEYQDGTITLRETTGDVMVFTKTGAAGASMVSGGLETEDDETEAQTPFQEYWNGDWYGFTSYSNGTNDYTSLDGFYIDCMAKIEIDENGEGGLILWDEATSVDEPRAGVYVSVSDGGFEQGRLKSVEGLFSDGDVGDADWLVDPDGLGYENLICIEGSYKDPDDFFSGYDYKIYLRPWGLDWTDIETDQPANLPDHYYDWYLPAIEAGSDMPDVIGGDYDSLAPGEVSDDQMEGQSGERYDPNASAIDGTWQAPVYGDYGLSKASATGVVPLTRDELADRIGFYADSQIGSAPYDSLYNSMGNYIHGKPLIDDPRWETGKTHVYQWSIESGEYATLVFEVTDYSAGIEILQSVETSPGLLD
ncbi:MAG: DUF5067 domain-containing protein [Acetatifactor sp.]